MTLVDHAGLALTGTQWPIFHSSKTVRVAELHIAKNTVNDRKPPLARISFPDAEHKLQQTHGKNMFQERALA